MVAAGRPPTTLLALSVAGTSLPVVGKHLEPLGGITAMGIWGARQAPRCSAGSRRSPLTPGIDETRQRDRERPTRSPSRPCAGSCRPRISTSSGRRRSGRRRCGRRCEHRYLHRGAVRYGDAPGAGARRLAPQGPAARPAPGADLRAGRRLGARQPDAAGLRADVPPGRAGLGVPVDRLPRVAAPPLAAAHHRRQGRHRVGARQRRPVRRRPRFRCDRGLFGRRAPGGAGRPDARRPDFQANLPDDADTSVDAVVGIYGRYDWEDRSTPERDRFVDFLERVVVKRRIARHPEVFRNASPIARVHRRCAAVLGGARHRGQRHPGRAGPELRRAAAGGRRARWSATWSCPGRATAST